MAGQKRNLRTRIDQLVRHPNTEQLLVRQVYGGRVPGAPQIFLVSLVFAALSLFIAFRLLRFEAGIISIFLIVLGLMPTFGLLVQREQSSDVVPTSRWYSRFRRGPEIRLALGVLSMFTAVMLAYAGCALVLPMDALRADFGVHIEPYAAMSAPDYRLEHFGFIFLNNLMVAVGVFLLSAIYRTGGALLILVWNASLWGTLFAYFSRRQSQSEVPGGAVIEYIQLMGAVLPHTLLEAFAYIVIALAGLIVTRLLVRGEMVTEESWTMVRSMLVLLGTSITLVLVATIVEVTLAPALLKAMQM